MELELELGRGLGCWPDVSVALQGGEPSCGGEWLCLPY